MSQCWLTAAAFLGPAISSHVNAVEGVQLKTQGTVWGSLNTTDKRFSRGRFTLESTADQSLNDSLDYEISARGDLDPILWNSSHYPQAVKNDERLQFSARKIFLSFTKLPFQARLGMQEVVWGEALSYFSADLLHPKDYRDFFLADLSYARRPQTGLWLNYASEAWSFEAVYFPWTEVNRYPLSGSEFFYSPVVMPTTLPEERRFNFKSPTLGANLGIKFMDLDLHLIGVFNRDFQPHYSPIQNRLVYGRLFSSAVTLSRAWDRVVVRLEASALWNRRVNFTDGVSVGLKKIIDTQYLGSFEWDLSDDIHFAQSFYLNDKLGQPPSGAFLQKRTLQVGPAIRINHLPWDFEVASTAWIEPKDPSVWWSSSIEKPLNDWAKAKLAVDQFLGDGGTVYSELSDRDQVSLKVEVFF